LTTITLGTKTLNVIGLRESLGVIGLQYDLWQNQVCRRQVVVYGGTRDWSVDCVEKDIAWADSAVNYLMGVASAGTAISFSSDDPRRPISCNVNILSVLLTLELTGTVNLRHFSLALHEV